MKSLSAPLGSPLLSLSDRPAELPERIRLRIALDVLEQLSQSDTPLQRRGGERWTLAHVEIVATGRARISDTSSGRGVAEVLWEILAGRLSEGSFPPLRYVMDEVTTDVAEVIANAFRSDHGYRSVAELQEELERAADGRIGSRHDVRRILELDKKASCVSPVDSPAEPVEKPKTRPPKPPASPTVAAPELQPKPQPRPKAERIEAPEPPCWLDSQSIAPRPARATLHGVGADPPKSLRSLMPALPKSRSSPPRALEDDAPISKDMKPSGSRPERRSAASGFTARGTQILTRPAPVFGPRPAAPPSTAAVASLDVDARELPWPKAAALATATFLLLAAVAITLWVAS